MKSVEFRGGSLADLRAFPSSARRQAGYQLDALQNGREAVDWKPMRGIGMGVREIRIREANGAFRIVYVANVSGMIYVLHCFQKKTQKTSRGDIDIAAARYRDLIKELSA